MIVTILPSATLKCATTILHAETEPTKVDTSVTPIIDNCIHISH
jgi:hypothetical protein